MSGAARSVINGADRCVASLRAGTGTAPSDRPGISAWIWPVTKLNPGLCQSPPAGAIPFIPFSSYVRRKFLWVNINK
jgi:hypothetical protein